MSEGDSKTVQLNGQCLLAVNPTSAYHVAGYLSNMPVCFMLDTGAPVSLVRKDIFDQVKGELVPWAGGGLVGVEGTPLDIHGMATVEIVLLGKLLRAEVIVASSLKAQAILGVDFLERNGCVINAAKRTLHLHGLAIPLQTNPSLEVVQASVLLQETLRIPGLSEVEVMVNSSHPLKDGTWLLEGMQEKDLPCLVARSLVTPVVGGDATCVLARLMNPASGTITLYKGTKIGRVERVEEAAVATVSGPDHIDKDDLQVTSEKRQMLWDTVERTAGDLSQAEKEQLYCLLLEYSGVFASSDADLGRTGRLKHSIDTTGSHPVRQRARRVPPIQREEMRQLLRDMLKRDVIQPSASPWASPVVLVRKRDGSLRFCIDYRKLNAVTRKDAYPLPRIDDTLETLAGSRWFTTLDLLSGYWQVEVAEEDREKTAFCTQEGLFEFKVMPFGLCNAPATFQRLMDLLLAGVQWSTCLVYIDDIVIPGKTFEEHMHNLQVVLHKLKEAGLRLKPSKCNFFQRQVCYLGHIVSENGVATDPAKTEKVAAWPRPTSVTDVQRFLGLASYYRRFIRNFAHIAKPLHQLTEKARDFQWSEGCEEAFQELKNRLTSAPILAFPDFDQPFVLDTDASQAGIGAVLSQVQEGQERVVAYASRTLSKAERRYCVTRRELLAVVTYVQHFRHYLLGHHFDLRTDHGSLTWLQGFREPEGQLARWLERLQEFDFKIIHRRGQYHGNADALSRRPCQQCGISHTEADVAPGAEVCSVTQKAPMEDLRQSQLSDDTVGPVLQAKEENLRPNPEQLKGRSRAFQQLIQLWEQLVVREGVLYRSYEDERSLGQHLQLIVPKQSRDEILRDIHGGTLGGHLGEAKTLSRVKERFYWPGHSEDAKLWCRNCPDCAARKTPAPKQRAPLQKVECGYPMQIVATDIVGPFPESDQGNTYVLVAADYFTRWVEAYAIPNQEATTVANKLVDEMFCRFSIPEQLHSDQGRQFESEVVQEVSRILQIHKTRTTPYHPQSDGLVERFNRTLLSMLAATVRNHPWDWENHLRKVCMAYNSSVHPATGFTPFQLMFGRQAKLPMDIVYGSPSPEVRSPSQYAADLKKVLEKSYETAREHLQTETKRQKELYNQKVHGKQFSSGDLVWLHSPAVPRGHSRKLHCPWVGPFKVVKRLSDAVYRIQDTRPRKRRSRVVVHFNRLKPCSSSIRINPIPEKSDPKTAKVTTSHHGDNLNVDMDYDEEVNQNNEPVDQRVEPVDQNDEPVDPSDEPVDPSDESVDQSDESIDQSDGETELNGSMPEDVASPAVPPPSRRYPARERHPPERFNTWSPGRAL